MNPLCIPINLISATALSPTRHSGANARIPFIDADGWEQGTPLCPKCGVQMVIRTAKKGNQRGEEFWGCRNYPKCREIVNCN